MTPKTRKMIFPIFLLPALRDFFEFPTGQSGPDWLPSSLPPHIARGISRNFGYPLRVTKSFEADSSSSSSSNVQHDRNRAIFRLKF